MSTVHTEPPDRLLPGVSSGGAVATQKPGGRGSATHLVSAGGWRGSGLARPESAVGRFAAAAAAGCWHASWAVPSACGSGPRGFMSPSSHSHKHEQTSESRGPRRLPLCPPCPGAFSWPRVGLWLPLTHSFVKGICLFSTEVFKCFAFRML